ncbi:MAG: vitamin K epoxide reductase family protein [Balneolaceae bacterium]
MSSYFMIGPFPVAFKGVLFYTLMLFSGIYWLDTRKVALFKYLPYITIPALIYSVWLGYIMLFVIEALCIYCLISAASTTFIMLISLVLAKYS